MTQFLLPLLVFFGKDLPVNKNTDASNGPDDSKTALRCYPSMRNSLYLVQQLWSIGRNSLVCCLEKVPVLWWIRNHGLWRREWGPLCHIFFNADVALWSVKIDQAPMWASDQKSPGFPVADMFFTMWITYFQGDKDLVLIPDPFKWQYSLPRKSQLQN